ncbi:YhjD/YihY/BrkB family envelope integrity protein [Streptomyces sp. NPDC003688]
MAWKARLERLRAEAERRFPVITELTSRLLSANLLDAATRLAAQAFLATVPLLFAFAAFAPEWMRKQLQDSLRAVFGLTGGSSQQLDQVLNESADPESRETSGIIGLVVTLASATSFSRAMARVCERAWRLPKASTRIAAWRWVVWLLVLVLVILFQAPVRDGFGVGLWLGTPLLFLVGTFVWLWTQRLLLAGRVPWIALLPGALLASAASTALSLTARIYMPQALNRSLREYGSLGLVLALLSWLIVLSAAITFAVTIGAVLAQEPPLNRWLGTESLKGRGESPASPPRDGGRPQDRRPDGPPAP